jgi:hypothetical protein
MQKAVTVGRTWGGSRHRLAWPALVLAVAVAGEACAVAAAPAPAPAPAPATMPGPARADPVAAPSATAGPLPAEVAAPAAAAAPLPGVVAAPQYFPPLARTPLDPPLRLAGTFGEYRPGHFHAGLDLSTGEQVGRPVYAALDGYVVRVRASGIGYGRSIYVQAPDGRMLVYGHLDAFDAPLAGYVAAAQDSSGEYEQDLWPAPPAPDAPARFPVRAGQRLGWSGRSGTDAPHLHFEIRRGDVAYNPLLAGVTVEDTAAPVFQRVALAPVARRGAGAGAGWRIECTGSDTALIAGPQRVVAEAVDARSDGRLTMAPWRVVLAGEAGEVECRFDSVSWAEGMSEVDFVYDRGRTLAAGRHAIVLGAPAGFRPRVLRGDGPLGAEVGSLSVPPGGRPLLFRLLAQDAAGHFAVETLAVGAAPAPPASGEPPGAQWVSADSAASGASPGFAWAAGAGTMFEDGWLWLSDLGRPEVPEELVPRSRAFGLAPALTPLRRPLRVSLLVPGAHPAAAPGPGVAEAGAGAAPGVARGGAAAAPTLGVYRDEGEGWEWIGADWDARTRTLSAATRALGRFALFRDATAPRGHLLPPPRSAPAGPYPRWALEVRVEEEGSGVDARWSWLEVDGRRVPSEWDAVARTLRWRPLRAPAGGRHEVEIVLRDRARNLRRRHATFVLD